MSNASLPYLYCLVRVVPNLDRGECLNVGLIMFSRPHRFLRAKFTQDLDRLRIIWPDLPIHLLQDQLRTLELIAASDSAGGPVAHLDIGERFHWLSNVSNTMIQPGPIHPGLTHDAESTFNRLFRTLVAASGAGL